MFESLLVGCGDGAILVCKTILAAKVYKLMLGRSVHWSEELPEGRQESGIGLGRHVTPGILTAEIGIKRVDQQLD